ncbi:inositol 1,4,5-trisphosphate receptor-interacting protein [Antennarius striatus]|uniref:inositol 1,4,5-trisphosphate receptor-interacting protein n=1 Tax=Antennarius striatus TaxID=241820 RepID=UPI0035B40847
MQHTLLGGFVVAFSLLLNLIDEPGVEEFDITKKGMQKHEEKLLRREVKLVYEMTPVNEEVKKSNNERPKEDVESISKEQNQSPPHTNGSNQPQNYESKPKTALKRSQVYHEQTKDVKTDNFFMSLIRQQGEPEEKEVLNSREDLPPLVHLPTKTSEKSIADWEGDYIWFLLIIFSIISIIELFRKHFVGNSQTKEEIRSTPATSTAGEVLLPDCATLHRFHSKCLQMSSVKMWREEEFLEGFAGDLLDAMRSICDQKVGMVMEDFRMVNACDITIPIRPSDPYGFQFLLLNNHPSHTEVCGKIKLVENKVQAGCHCQPHDVEDMVCLLHCEPENIQLETSDVCDGILCLKNSPFLSKSQVTRWFQSTVKQAWMLISHKYMFEMNIQYIDGPGALAVRFRSGKKISFRMNPVVKFNTHAHFFIAPGPLDFDTLWTLSLTDYKDRLIGCLSKHLPENSCHSQALEIALFLHKKQMALSGSCALKDFHFEMALLHLLLTTNPSPWKPNDVACWLRDLLNFMGKSLEKKLLHHALIGNPLTLQVIDLPAQLTQAKVVNLFHHLVVHHCTYRNTVIHFQELLRNAHMLIQVYLDR